MTPLRRRLMENLTVRGYSENTQQAYLSSVLELSRYYNRSPDQLSAGEIQRFLIHLHKERGLAISSCSRHVHGLRFFYRVALGWPETTFSVPRRRQPKRLPEILSQQEILALFQAAASQRDRVLLMTAYRDGSAIKVMQLEADEFIRRFLLHVLPTGLMRIRHYGLFANRCRRDKLARCRDLLQQPEPESPSKESTEAMVERLTGKDITRCTVCGKGRLTTVATLLPIYPTGPPRWW